MSEMNKSEHNFLTKHNITTVETGKFICSSCNCPISGIRNVKQHLDGYLHQSIVHFKKPDTIRVKHTAKKNNRSQHNSVAVKKDITNKRGQKLPNSHRTMKTTTFEYMDNIYFEKMDKMYFEDMDDMYFEDMDEIPKQLFICAMCSIEYDSRSALQQHLNSSSTHFRHQPKDSAKKSKINNLSTLKMKSNPPDESSDESDISFNNTYFHNKKVNKPEVVAKKPNNEVQNGVRVVREVGSKDMTSQTPNGMQEIENHQRKAHQHSKIVKLEVVAKSSSSEIKNEFHVQKIENQQNKDHRNTNVIIELENLSSNLKKTCDQFQNQNSNFNSQPTKTPINVVSTNKTKQTVPLLKPQIQPQPVKQQKKNQQSAKVMKPDEGNSFAKQATSQIQTKVEGQEASKRSSQTQNEVIQAETEKQMKTEENPLLKQIDQISKKNKEENLLFLYESRFLSPGNQNILNGDEVNKLIDCFWVTFVRNDTINCVICAKQMANDVNKLSEHVRSFEHEQNLESILENHSHFAEFPDQYSDLRLARELMCEVSDDEIACFVCVAKLQNNDAEIDCHLKMEKHKTMRAEMIKTMVEMGQSLINSFQDNWYHVDHYSCLICSKNFISEIQFFNHLNAIGHKEKIPTEAKYRFEFCIPCSSLWYGQESSYGQHLRNHKHEFNLITERYLVPEMPARAKKIFQDVEGFVETVFEFNEKKDLLDIVPLAISDLNESTHKKGAIPVSEIELEQLPGCVDCTLIAKDRGSSEENFKLVNMLRKTQNWQQVYPQRYTHSYMMFNTKYAFQCQITFDNTLFTSTRCTWCYFIKFSSCKRAMFFLQNWLVYCNFDLNQISCFVLAWFVIFYYQNVHNYPSLQEVMSSGVYETTSSSIHDDLKGFFEFYSTFDFKTLVLCPMTGKAVKKTDYFSSTQNGKWRFILNSPVVLENPAKEEGTINLAQNMTKLTLRTFRHYCAESLKLLS